MDHGRFYGYPQCCIDEFSQQKHMKGDQDALLKRIAEAGLYNCGFVPCEAHLQQLIDRKVTIKQLIVGRICKNPFPIGRYDPPNKWDTPKHSKRHR
jgi:hypothetical protein